MHVENGNILDVLFAGKDLFEKQGKLWINPNDLFMNNDDNDNNNETTEKFIQYYCRLRGNFLFVIDLDNLLKPLNLIILGRKFTIKLCEPKTSDCLLFEFCILLDVHNKKNTAYHLACETIEERDDWIKKIYLTSFNFLHSLHKALSDDFLHKQNSFQNDDINDGIDDVDLLKYHRIIIGCDNVLTLCNHSDTSPRLFIKLFIKRNPPNKQRWKFLGQTESIQSKSPQFVNSISFTFNENTLETELKFELYYIIEPRLEIEFLCAYAYGKIPNYQSKIFKTLNLKCPKNNEIIGQIKFQIIDDCSTNILSHHHHHQLIVNNNNSNMSDQSKILDYENIQQKLFNAPIIKRSFFNAYDQSISSEIILEECMQDTRFVFVIPMIILKSYAQDENFIRNLIHSQKQLLSKCDFYQKLVDFHSKNINLLENVVNEIAEFMLDNTFRPSTMKKEFFLQFVPINFHRQMFRVNFMGKSSNTLSIYTVGAFACHHYGFEKYNWKLSMLKNLIGTQTTDEFVNVDETWKLLQKLMKISHNERIIFDHLNDLIKHFDDDNRLEIKFLYKRIHDYAEELIDLIDDDESSVNEMMMNTITMSEHLPINYSEECQLEPIDLIYLNIKACFVDINDKIDDQNQKKFIHNEFEPCNRKLRNAISSLKRTIFACYINSFAQLKSPKDFEYLHQIKFRWLSLMSQSLTTLIIFIQDQLLDDKNNGKFLASINRTGFILIFYETLLSCFSEEIGMLEDMIYALDTISNNTIITICFDGHDSSGIMIPEIDFNNDKIHLLFHIDSAKKIDEKFSIKLNDRIECRLLLLIFNIGVNQQASLPNNIFKKSLQDEINAVSFSKMKIFIIKFHNDDSNIRHLLMELENELNENKLKNIQILKLANEIVRHLDGTIKVTCCKSAKDRTGMSVTLEEVRFVFEYLQFDKHLHSHLFQTMLDTLRRNGTRIENVRKNIGAKKYAFNYLCLLTFPMEFRPPLGTYSNVES